MPDPARSVTAFEAKTRLGQLLDRVAAGQSVTITKHGKPIARLTPLAAAPGPAEAALATFRAVRVALAAASKPKGRK